MHKRHPELGYLSTYTIDSNSKRHCMRQTLSAHFFLVTIAINSVNH
jgi:hypothetical protein